MCVEVGVLSAQVGDGFHQYFYPDGKVSSEGILVDGKPEGHWKTFYETGVLKSEGNRVDFQLDSTWSVSYTHLRAHETVLDLVCRLLLDKKKNTHNTTSLTLTH